MNIKLKKFIIENLGILAFMLIIEFFMKASAPMYLMTVAAVAVICIPRYLVEHHADRTAPDRMNHHKEKYPVKYDDFRQENYFERPVKSSMKADLRYRYRNGTYIGLIIIGVVSLAVGAAVFCFRRSAVQLLVLSIIVGLFFISIGLILSMGINVKKFINDNKNNIEKLNNAYMSGRMINNSESGINISSEYVFYYDIKEIIAVPSEKIKSACVNCDRIKQYNNGLYTGDMLEYSLALELSDNSQPVKLKLGEFRSQLALDELYRAGILNMSYGEQETQYNLNE